MWFEDKEPSEYPELAMAAVTTHDLPTIAGLWSGEDLDVQRQLELQPNVDGWQQIRRRLATLAAVDDDAGVEDVIVGTHAALADAHSLLVSGTLDDAIAVVERPNMPGTTTEWPNWWLALPMPLEELEEQDLPSGITEVMKR